MIVVAEEPLLPCEFGTIVLEPNVIADDPQEVTYLWPNGSTMPFIEVDSPGVYSLAITNTCETVIQDFAVEFEDDKRSSLLFIPNVFSPNGDGINDEFRAYIAKDIEVLFFELNIYDRWGNHLTSFSDTDDFWDGKFDDEMMNPGVFVYYYRVTLIACGRKVEYFRKGDVTLVK
jgi:gliding motility-associated-like protein